MFSEDVLNFINHINPTFKIHQWLLVTVKIKPTFKFLNMTSKALYAWPCYLLSLISNTLSFTLSQPTQFLAMPQTQSSC